MPTSDFSLCIGVPQGTKTFGRPEIMSAPLEAHPRTQVDAVLASAGWVLQDGNQADANAAYAVAVRRFPLAFSPTHGNSDYLLYISGLAIGVVRILAELPVLKQPDHNDRTAADGGEAYEEAKETSEDDHSLPSAEPLHWHASVKKPVERRQGARSVFVYETDGTNIHFYDARQEPVMPRKVSQFHRPYSLAAWLTGLPVLMTAKDISLKDDDLAGATLLQRLEALPRIADRALWPGERMALEALETSLRRRFRRSVAQMAPGSGKTHTLLNLAFQLLEHGKLHRVLLLVDNDPLAYQTTEEFRTLRPPAHGSPSATPLPFDVFPDKHTLPVQQLSGHSMDPGARLIVSSPYRVLTHLYGAKGGEDGIVSRTLFSPERALEINSLGADAGRAPNPHANHELPMEAFDVILCDDLSPGALEALESALNYFDAPVLAAAGTPCRQVLEFFDNHIVSEYSYEQAIADGSILPFETYAIRVSHGANEQLEAQAGPLEIHREPEYISRLQRWKITEDDFENHETAHSGNGTDADARELADFTTLLTLRDRLRSEIISQRNQVPKTLIIARDDAHAAVLLELVKEVFSGEEFFARLLTTPAPEVRGDYSDTVFHAPATGVSRAHGEPRTPSPDAHYPYLTAYRSDVFPRIGIVAADSFAVTVDLRPTEVIVLMAEVNSRAQFEAIKGRAIRTVRRAEYLRVTPDGHSLAGKTHAVIVDAVGLFDQEAPSETFPLDRRPTIPIAQLLQEIAFGSISEHTVRSVAARFLVLDCLLSPAEKDQISKAAGGATLHTLATRLISSLDTERKVAQAARSLRPGLAPTEKMVDQAAIALMQQAVARLHSSVDLRTKIIQLDRQYHPKPEADSIEEQEPIEDLGNEETWR